jgi:hypothetical protein
MSIQTTRIVGVIGAIQVLGVLLAHACGVAGCAWAVELYEEEPSIRSLPLVIFFAKHGLWLLFLPPVWFAITMIRIKSPTRPSNGWFWVILGALIAFLLIVAAVLSFIIPMFPMGWRHHGVSW